MTVVAVFTRMSISSSHSKGLFGLCHLQLRLSVCVGMVRYVQSASSHDCSCRNNGASLAVHKTVVREIYAGIAEESLSQAPPACSGQA